MAHVTHVTPDIGYAITQLEALGIVFQVFARRSEKRELHVVEGAQKLNAKCRANLEIQEPAIVEFLTGRQGVTTPCDECGESPWDCPCLPF